MRPPTSLSPPSLWPYDGLTTCRGWIPASHLMTVGIAFSTEQQLTELFLDTATKLAKLGDKEKADLSHWVVF